MGRKNSSIGLSIKFDQQAACRALGPQLCNTTRRRDFLAKGLWIRLPGGARIIDSLVKIGAVTTVAWEGIMQVGIESTDPSGSLNRLQPRGSCSR